VVKDNAANMGAGFGVAQVTHDNFGNIQEAAADDPAPIAAAEPAPAPEPAEPIGFEGGDPLAPNRIHVPIIPELKGTIHFSFTAVATY
jgi:hypothetical protein